jgi:photosystem II stability/assembly factor-like uncharacterized protein
MRIVTPLAVLCALGFAIFAAPCLAQTATRSPESELCPKFKSTTLNDGPPEWEAEEKKVGSDEPLSGLHFLDGQNGWAAGERSLYRTSDGGSTWRLASLRVPEDY